MRFSSPRARSHLLLAVLLAVWLDLWAGGGSRGLAVSPPAPVWYRVGVTRVDVTPTHNGVAWDEDKPQMARSCCHPKADNGKSTLPDIMVTLRFGKQTFSTRVRENELHPEFRDFGFIQRAGDEPLAIEVWDDDETTRELVGRTQLSVGAGGELRARAFDSVESIVLYTERVTAPEAAFSVEGEGELDTHLFVASGEQIVVSARGQVCFAARERCFEPASVASASGAAAGRLTVILAANEHEQRESYRSGLIMTAQAAGPLHLFVNPDPGGRPLSGTYQVLVALRP